MTHRLVSLLGTCVALFNGVEGLGQLRERDFVGSEEAPKVAGREEGVTVAPDQQPDRRLMRVGIGWTAWKGIRSEAFGTTCP